MTTKEQIKDEIDNLKDADLEELHMLIKDFVRTKAAPQPSSFMARMRNIKIEAPEDFSTNLDQYTSGEKSIE